MVQQENLSITLLHCNVALEYAYQMCWNLSLLGNFQGLAR